MFATIKRIILWCEDFKKQLYIGFVFSFFSYWFAAFPVVAASYAVEKLITLERNGETLDKSLIWISFFAILLFVFLRFLFDYLRAKHQETISYELVARDRLAIGEALKRVSLGYFQNISTGNILNSITTGLTTLESMGIRMLDTFIGGYLNFLAILTGLFILKPFCAVTALIFAGISFVSLIFLSKASEKNAPIAAESNRQMTKAVLEYARGLSIIKSFGKGGEAAKNLEASFEKSKEAHLKTELSFIPPNCIHLLSLKCGSIGIAVSAALSLLNGSLPLSYALTLIFLSFIIFSSLEPVSDSAHVLGVIDDAMDRVDYLRQEHFIDEDGQEIKLSSYDIEFKNVSFGYDEREILKDISFKIPQNTSTAIVGPSGSGKTTIVNLIARFYDVNKGSITVGNHNVREFTCDSLLSNISMVFQNVYLFNDTVRNNICFGKDDATEEEMIEAAKKACCHDFIMSLPDGYDTVVGEGGGRLSGGEKQRISIARAILKNTPVIILDEATASIDPENEHLIQKAISELTKGKTVITIAHRLATIENADQILVIEDGRLEEKGRHSELIKNNGLYSRFIEARKNAEGWSIS